LSPIALLIWVIVFAACFGIVTWLVPPQPARNIFYAVIAVIAVLVFVGLLTGGVSFVRVH
jgi:hypothetical protein